MELFAPAKLNLCLDILRKSDSGYHEIQTVSTCTNLYQNRIEIFETQQKQNMGTPEGLAQTAIQLLKDEHKVDKNIEIKIHRGIPFSSGMGGESSNAAVLLRALNDLWALSLNSEQLMSLGARLGCDVPFFIEGGTALCTHYGEMVEPLPHIELSLEIIPRTSIQKSKTQQAYTSLDLSRCGHNTNQTAKLIAAIKSGDQKGIAKNLHNDFEQLYEIKPGEHLTGAGPSTFKVLEPS